MIPYYVHTSYFNYFLKKKNVSIKSGLSDMLKDLIELSSNNLIIPTYNYNYPKKKIFDVKSDISEVGSFSEFFRKKFIENRSPIPVFSSCSTFNDFIKDRKFDYKIDPFGNNSDFQYLLNNKGKIINFEVDFAPTFIIFIENFFSKKILYRYTKLIKGQIKYKNIINKTEVKLFVRPRRILIEYDLKKIKYDLINNKILKKKKFRNCNYEMYDANDFFEYCAFKIKKDNMYFLNQKTKFLLNKKLNIKNKDQLKIFD